MSDVKTQETASAESPNSTSQLKGKRKRSESPESERGDGVSGSGGSRKSESPEESGSSSSEQEGEQGAGDSSESTHKPIQNDAESGATHGWQAIYSSQHNAYYFYNNITQETTWANPLQPESSGTIASSSGAGSTPSGADLPASQEEAPSTSPTDSAQARPGPSSHYSALQAAALAQGIDPALAHLDPSLLSSVPGHPTDASGIPLFTAKFNRHTGAFAKADSRDPGHFSEYERAKRMSEFYFDVNGWENQLAEQGGSIKGDEANKKRKKLTKKDLERFKEQKKQKKLAKTAWLRT